MADLNDPNAPASARQPRAAVLVNGEQIPGWTSWEVDNNAYRAADTFRVQFVASDLPEARNAAWFAEQRSVSIEIRAGFPKDVEHHTAVEMPSLIYGDADEIAFDPVAGTVEINGRDLTARLIDTKTSEHFANQTASSIVKTLAARHGLVPVVTQTDTPSGDYYKDDHAQVTQQQSEWDLLAFLANQEGFVVFIRGKELHFEPRKEPGDHYAIAWQKPTAERGYPVCNAIELRFSRALTVAKGVSVEVHSWNAKHKKGFSAYWPKAAKAVKPGQAKAETRIYKYTFPGLTPDTALKKAQTLYAQIIAHEMRLTCYMPGDSLLWCDIPIDIRGTGTAFDQTYYPDSVKRSMSASEGYRMNITAKNTSPELEQEQ